MNNYFLREDGLLSGHLETKNGAVRLCVCPIYFGTPDGEVFFCDETCAHFELEKVWPDNPKANPYYVAFLYCCGRKIKLEKVKGKEG